MDISNKSLALLLVVAVFVSFLGTYASLNKIDEMQSITGFATSGNDTGTVTLEITENVTITFTVDSINWGTGTVANDLPGLEYCEMMTNGTLNPVNCTTFNNVTTPFRIANEGNENVSLQIKSNASAATLFGAAATSPEFQWKAEDNATTGGCSDHFNATILGGFVDVSTSDVYVCGSPTTQWFGTGIYNVMHLHMRVNFPEDTASGAKAALITATGTSGT